MIGPEMGYTQPGMTIVCGDSHTSTHGAFGALAFGIGTSEVEHVLATQTLPQSPPKWMSVTVDGDLPADCSAKDIILAIIQRIGTGGGVGHVVEYRGSAIRALSMEGRMTICNMSIEAGARAGMVAPDDTTFAYVEGKPFAPKGDAWEPALEHWRSLPTDDGAAFDTEVVLDAADAPPVRELGDEPGAVDDDRRRRPGPRRRRGGAPGAALHGSRAGHADARHPPRHDLHRLVHELSDRGPARGRGRRARPDGARTDCARSSSRAASP